MMFGRICAPASMAIAALVSTAAIGQNTYAPGITDTEITIGQTMPYSGAVSAWGTVGRAELAYFKMINDQGGINGRRINLVSLDDAFSPPKTVEQTRRLVEEKDVSILFGSLGPGNLAIRKYLNDRRIPQLFVLAPTEVFNDPQHFPWTIGFQPTYYLDGKTHAQYILAHKPNAKIAILNESDEIHREAVKGLRDGLGDQADRLIVKQLSYEATDPTIDSQIVTLQSSGADTFYNVSSPKFATQAIRKTAALGWKPLHFLAYGSQSISTVLEPAGLSNATGIISAAFAKDPSDPRWKDDPNTSRFLQWLEKYYPNGSPSDIFVVSGWMLAQPLAYVLKQCGRNLSRDSIMREATNLHEVSMSWLLPGLTLNTSPTDYQPIKEMREMRFNGSTWDVFER
jgi:branched-chain amino acid transport system substrate-binding protein